MPTYEYACSSCNNEWEFEQSIKADPIKECPKCHEQTARRQISRGTGFILKGSGWYSDLYSSAPSPKKSEGSGGSTETKSEGSSEKKSEASGSSSSSGGDSTPAAKPPSTAAA